MKRMWQILILVGLTVTANAQVPAATIPAFSFAKQDKSLFTNKDLASGKKLFFVFFDSECDHCRHAITYLNSHQPELNNAAVYLLTLDAPEKTKEFLKKHGPNLLNRKNILILRDYQDQFINRFKPRKYPSLFLYSQQQKLILYDDDEKQLPVFLKNINNKS